MCVCVCWGKDRDWRLFMAHHSKPSRKPLMQWRKSNTLKAFKTNYSLLHKDLYGWCFCVFLYLCWCVNAFHLCVYAYLYARSLVYLWVIQKSVLSKCVRGKTSEPAHLIYISMNLSQTFYTLLPPTEMIESLPSI